MEQPIHLAGTTLQQHRHICAFFDDTDEERQVLNPFIKEGIERGEKAFHIVDPSQRVDYARRLEEDGIPLTDALRRGQFDLRGWDEAYLIDGHFDQDRMLALIEGELVGAAAQGFPLTRLVAHMEWALEDRPGVADVVEYEARLNYLLPRYRDVVI
jgi:hypothetical protein